MTAPREDILHAVRQWVQFADEDLRVATHALSLEPRPNRHIAYLAQQCAE